jgi:prepilin-type N-terminal cleavage/methylation domain-containing protein
MNGRRGFTLIELLLVIAVIVALAVTVFVALNPSTRLANARDARRTSDVDTILTATHEYIVDNSGSLPTGISTSTDTMIGACATSAAVTTGNCNVTAASACVNLGTSLAAYLKSAPTDPLNGTASVTNYTITSVATSGIVTVKACGAEKLTQIWASR